MVIILLFVARGAERGIIPLTVGLYALFMFESVEWDGLAIYYAI